MAWESVSHAQWVPLESFEPRRPGLLDVEVGDTVFEPLPEEDLDAWEG